MSSNSVRISLTQGPTSSVSAEVICTLVLAADELQSAKCKAITLDGAYLEGPFSSRGRTLPSKFPLKSGSPHTDLAIIPEPALWTPRMPNYYELRGLHGIPENFGIPEVQTRIGLREAHVRRESFYHEDRRWVVRACVASPVKVLSEFDQWQTADLVPIVTFGQGIDDLLKRSMEFGLPLIVDFSMQPEKHWWEQFVTCSRFASTSFALIPPIENSDFESVRGTHLIVGRSPDSSAHPIQHAQFVVVSEGILRTGWSADHRLPVVATRECDIEDHTPAELRTMCDQFQADLDHGADYAGLWLLPKATS